MNWTLVYAFFDLTLMKPIIPILPFLLSHTCIEFFGKKPVQNGPVLLWLPTTGSCPPSFTPAIFNVTCFTYTIFCLEDALRFLISNDDWCLGVTACRWRQEYYIIIEQTHIYSKLVASHWSIYKLHLLIWWWISMAHCSIAPKIWSSGSSIATGVAEKLGVLITEGVSWWVILLIKMSETRLFGELLLLKRLRLLNIWCLSFYADQEIKEVVELRWCFFSSTLNYI